MQVTQLSPEVHARHGGIYTGGRQENVSGWSRKYISHGRSDTMGNDTATGDSHLRTYHNSPPPGQDQYGADTVWGETAHGHSPGKRHFPDAEGPPAGDAFPREDMMASYGIQHQKRHILSLEAPRAQSLTRNAEHTKEQPFNIQQEDFKYCSQRHS